MQSTLRDDSDLAILQANERTLLAWIRTGLSLVALGLVMARFGLSIGETGPQSAGPVWVAGCFVGIGVFANAMATARYLRIRRAILTGEPIVDGFLPIVFAAAVTLLGAVVGTFLLFRRF